MPGMGQVQCVGLLMVSFSYLGIQFSVVLSPGLQAIGNRSETGFLSRVRLLMPTTATVRGLPGASSHTTNYAHCQMFKLHVPLR